MTTDYLDKVNQAHRDFIKAIENLEKFYGKIVRIEAVVSATGEIQFYRVYKSIYNKDMLYDEIECCYIDRKE